MERILFLLGKNLENFILVQEIWKINKYKSKASLVVGLLNLTLMVRGSSIKESAFI